MKIETRAWKEFALYEIFEVSRGNKLDKGKMISGDIAFVGRTALNNGINDRVDFVKNHPKYGTVEPYEAGSLTLALGGSIGSCFLQKEPFYTSQNVAVLIPDKSISDEALMFAASVITHTVQSGIYEAFKEELNKHLMTDFALKLPVTKSGEPDWDYTEQFVTDRMAEANNFIEKVGWVEMKKQQIDTSTWKEFRVVDVFPNIVKPKVLHNREVLESDEGIPYVVRSKFGNGIKCRVEPVDGVEPSPAGVITWGAENATFFYQEEPFYSGRDIYYLDTRDLSKNACLFIATCLQTVAHKYPYNFGLFPDLLKEEIIKLPVTKSGEPDWDYMENFMKQIRVEQEATLNRFENVTE